MTQTCRFLILALVMGMAGTSGTAVAAWASEQESRPQDPATYLNRRLDDVLRELQKEGLRIIFSDELVRPHMRVTREPHSRELRSLLSELLLPHGLAVREGQGGTLMIVQAPATIKRTITPPARKGSGAAGTLTKPGGTGSETDEPRALPRIEEHVEVTGRHPPEVRPPTSIDMLPAQVQDAAGGFANPLQVLQMLPGVAAINDQEGRLAVRGAAAEHNLVLLDGVPIRNPFRLTYVPTSLFNPATVSRVAVDASGLDASLGGLSSALVIDTRDGATAERLAGSASLSMLSGDVMLEGRAPGTRTGSWWVSGRGTYYDLVADRFARGGDEPGFRDLQFKVALNPTPRTRLSFIGLTGQGSMKEPDHAGSGDRFVTSNQIGVATLRWAPTARMTTTTSLSAYSDSSHFFDFPQDETNQFDRRTRIRDFAFRQGASVRLASRHVVDVGIEARRLDTGLAMTGRDAPEWLPSSAGPNLWGQHVTYLDGPLDSTVSKTELTWWLQDHITLGPSVDVRPGLRVVWNSFTGETALLPRMLLTKRLGGSTRTWAGIGWQAQTPGHETMLTGIAAYDFTPQPAVRLRNERARQAILGIERRFGSSTALRAEAYHRTFDRLLVQRLETDDERAARLRPYDLPADLPPDSAYREHRPTIHPESTGTGGGYGVEVLAQRDGARASGWLSYTWSKAERNLFGRTVSFDFDRRHALDVSGSVRLSPGVRLSASWHLASGYPVSPDSPDVQFLTDLDDRDHDGNRAELIAVRDATGSLALRTGADVGPRLSLLNTARLGLYSRTDLRLTFTRGRWQYYGELVNLFDHRNHQYTSSADGISRGQESYGSYGRLPSFGVQVRF